MRLPMNRALTSALLAAALGVGWMTAGAVAASRPLVMVQAADDDTAGPPPIDEPNSAAALTVRLDRLENTVRSLTGQIEQLQFQNRKLSDDLRKMQQDTDFRFQDLEKGGAKPGAPMKRTEATPPAGSEGMPQDASGADPAIVAGAPIATPKPARRVGDAFDPNASPDAPGAPRPLGTVAPSAPLARKDVTVATGEPSAPLDLMRRSGSTVPVDQSTDNGVPAVRSEPAPADAAPRVAPNPNAVASLAPGGTRDEYNNNLDLYRQGQLDTAATGFKSFLDKYPRDRLVPDVVYYLGETYTKLGRHREAAEQYLRLSTDFSKAPRAPDALLKLGMALNAMGVREQACATYQEVTRRYPAASSDVRAGVDRELKRSRC